MLSQLSDKSIVNNPEEKLKLELQLELFNIMFGPFDRLEDNEPFIGTEKKPLGANFYPEDMTKEEFENWIKQHPEDEKSFTSEFTVIRRQNGKLVAIPYSEYYKDYLIRISNLLKEAAEYADNPSLKKYLLSRAEAFLSNDYYQSDMDWMDLKDHNIEVVIGPYEVYEDGLFNYKASFESFVTIKDPIETKKLEIFSKYLNDIEKNLPLDEKHKNYQRGSESPIVVVNEVFTAGDTKAGVQTLAFNLPNDERVRKAKGSKKVMLKNVHEEKFVQKSALAGVIILLFGHIFYSGLFPKEITSITPNPIFFLERLGYILVLFYLCWLADKKFNFKPAFILDASRESLLVYWLHLIIIYGMFWNGKSLAGIIGMTMNVTEAIGATISLITLMIVVAKIWGWLKKTNPRYTSLGVKIFVAALFIVFILS